MLKKAALGILAAMVLLNVGLAIVAFVSTRDRDLSLADTAVEFEEAVIGGNYEGMWDLSAPEYRDGLNREQFIERAREQAPTPDRIFNWSVLNETAGEIARVHTRLQLAAGGIETNRMMLRNVDGEWRITEYQDYDGPWPPEDPPLVES